MLANRSILIVEDEPLIALDLSIEVEMLDGRVVGPTPSVAGALAILENEQVCAAILDSNLADRDVTPVALWLIQCRVPFVIHSGLGIPEQLALRHPSLGFVPKPAPASAVLAHLLAVIAED